MNRVNSFECVCANGFRGKQCDEESYDSVTFDAHQYGATTQARADGLTNAQVVLIAVFSVAMPLVAVIAACVVFCMKRKRKRAQEKDDAEARKQNEQNAVATMHHNGSGVGVALASASGRQNWQQQRSHLRWRQPEYHQKHLGQVGQQHLCLSSSSGGGGSSGGRVSHVRRICGLGGG